MKLIERLFLLTVLLAGSLVACNPPAAEPPAAETPPPATEEAATPSGPEILDPWARVLPNGMGAVYLSIRNPGDERERLVAVEMAAATAAEIHESVEENGVMRMIAHPEGFEIPAGSTLDLEPGGKHIMLIEPQVPEDAESLPITLRFERAGAVEIDAALVEISEIDDGEMDDGDTDEGDTDHGG